MATSGGDTEGGGDGGFLLDLVEATAAPDGGTWLQAMAVPSGGSTPSLLDLDGRRGEGRWRWWGRRWVR